MYSIPATSTTHVTRLVETSTPLNYTQDILSRLARGMRDNCRNGNGLSRIDSKVFVGGSSVVVGRSWKFVQERCSRRICKSTPTSPGLHRPAYTRRYSLFVCKCSEDCERESGVVIIGRVLSDLDVSDQLRFVEQTRCHCCISLSSICVGDRWLAVRVSRYLQSKLRRCSRVGIVLGVGISFC
jgi:hypothetical protein